MVLYIVTLFSDSCDECGSKTKEETKETVQMLIDALCKSGGRVVMRSKNRFGGPDAEKRTESRDRRSDNRLKFVTLQRHANRETNQEANSFVYERETGHGQMTWASFGGRHVLQTRYEDGTTVREQLEPSVTLALAM